MLPGDWLQRGFFRHEHRGTENRLAGQGEPIFFVIHFFTLELGGRLGIALAPRKGG